MAIQTVKTGAAVNDGTGDDARTASTTNAKRGQAQRQATWRR